MTAASVCGLAVAMVHGPWAVVTGAALLLLLKMGRSLVEAVRKARGVEPRGWRARADGDRPSCHGLLCLAALGAH